MNDPMDHGLTLEEVQTLRDRSYHQTPALRVGTPDEALAFVNQVGFCLLFGAQDIEMPSLWGAITGSRRPMPKKHFDADVGRAWAWKDELPARGVLHYGKLLRGKPMLVSLETLPWFYALSPNYGSLEDYLEQYQEGQLSAEAKSVYEALLEHGAMATSRLRQLAGLAGGGPNARRFEKAITDLQIELKIAKTGISNANRWKYAYVYDLFVRRYPDVPEQARRLSTDEAMERLLLLYMTNVVAETESLVKRLFRWETWDWDRLLTRLTEQHRVLRHVHVTGLGEDCLARIELPTM